VKLPASRSAKMASSAAIASRLSAQAAACSPSGRQHATAGSAFSSSLRTTAFVPTDFKSQSKSLKSKSLKNFKVTCAAAEQMEDASELRVQRRGIMAAAAALSAALIGESFSGHARADIQKVEGARRDEQDAVTQGRREPSTLGRGAGNTVQEAGRVNAQASGGTITGAPKLEKPGGAYRSPQSDTLTIGQQVDSKKSTPAGVLQGDSPGKSKGEKSSPV